ncbi:ATP-binding protein [Nonomuraea sediminis]|uniref:ATP-binding protein n=1 Tax=Nonomuraea sediminis TaxID=2835864 RepID=UPI001BDC847D|nr:ATP-binding protein [Nonomuraea sediminis]
MTSRLSSDILSRSYTLSSVSASVPAARIWVRQMLARWKLTQLTEPAELLVSELITNAIKHAKTGGAPITLVLSHVSGTLRLEVHDPDQNGRPIPQQPAADEEVGRGLWIVGTFADRWDVEITEVGKAVWFELDTAGAMA